MLLRFPVSTLPLLRPSMRLDLRAMRLRGALWVRGALCSALCHVRKPLAGPGPGTVAELQQPRLRAEFLGSGPLTPQNRGFCRRRATGV